MLNYLRKYIRLLKHKTKYLVSSTVVMATGKRKQSNAILRSYKDKYSGQRCFVIGNGPSLTKEDLELLKTEVTFASNRIYKMFEQTDWRPTFYAALDDSVASDEDVIKNANKCVYKVKFLREQGWLSNRKHRSACYIHTWYDRKYLEEPAFSRDLTKGVYTIATVTYTLIQIARYMGFSEIYLIGVDHKYANEMKKDGTVVKNEGIKSYFGNQERLETSVVAASWEMEKVYGFAEEYSRANGFRIYNATRGGYLEVFERVNLVDIISI